MTNVETGQAIQPRSHLSRLETTGALVGTVHWETRGSFLFLLFPGEPGPYGPVEAPGALLAPTGRAVATYDSSSDQIIAFSFEGSITDVCAAPRRLSASDPVQLVHVGQEALATTDRSRVATSFAVIRRGDQLIEVHRPTVET